MRDPALAVWGIEPRQHVLEHIIAGLLEHAAIRTTVTITWRGAVVTSLLRGSAMKKAPPFPDIEWEAAVRQMLVRRNEAIVRTTKGIGERSQVEILAHLRRVAPPCREV